MWGGSYRHVRVAKVGPAEQVDQSVEAGQLAARQLFSLHHGGVFCPVHVVDGGDHAQTWRGTGQTSIPPSDAVVTVNTSLDAFTRAASEGRAE